MMIAPSTARAAGNLTYVQKFVAGADELDLATYTEVSSAGVTEKVGLLGIKNEGRGSFAFSPGEWQPLVDLFKKATQMQSASWQFVGTLKEVGTKDPTLLLMTAGPGVRVTLETADGSFSFVVSPADFDRFETGLSQVAAFLAG